MSAPKMCGAMWNRFLIRKIYWLFRFVVFLELLTDVCKSEWRKVMPADSSRL